MGRPLGSHAKTEGDAKTGIGTIEHQGMRILGLISRMGHELDPDEIKRAHPEVSDLDVTRPNGERLRVLQLPAMVDGQRLQAELIAHLVNSTTPVPSLLVRATKLRHGEDAERHLGPGRQRGRA